MFDIKEFSARNSDVLAAIYGSKKGERIERISKAVAEFKKIYGSDEGISVFSVPGRSEICGNHTDHNRGEVFAASIDLDIIAVARKTNDGIIRLKSEGFPEDTVDISNLIPVKEETGKSSSLIRGVCAGMKERNHNICSFEAYTTSNVLAGSGLSSSAAFEDMIGTIINHFANNGSVEYLELSQISQYSENRFFGKPCGLMDQVACAAGGFVHIDFNNTSKPECNKISFDITGKGYSLCIVATGGSHADLTDDYASVPAEMKKVASFFGKEVLRDVPESDVIDHIADLRKFAGDRAILRALHFYNENKRVRRMQTELSNNNIDGFLAVVNESGVSSAWMLQNYFSTKAPSEQGITLACAAAKEILAGKGAVRVHGGGFAGTMQAFVPSDFLESFTAKMEALFGKGSVTVLSVRPYGAIKFS